MPVESVVEYQRVWIEGLNRGDVSAADAAFAPDCIVHITGIAEPLRGLGPWKVVVGACMRPHRGQTSAAWRVVEADRRASSRLTSSRVY